jgi:hypothetical protein
MNALSEGNHGVAERRGLHPGYFGDNYFGNDVCGPGKKATPGIKSPLRVGCLHTLAAAVPPTESAFCCHIRNAHAESRTRVTSMGGLYDAATLHALLL